MEIPHILEFSNCTTGVYFSIYYMVYFHKFPQVLSLKRDVFDQKKNLNSLEQFLEGELSLGIHSQPYFALVPSEFLSSLFGQCGEGQISWH